MDSALAPMDTVMYDDEGRRDENGFLVASRTCFAISLSLLAIGFLRQVPIAQARHSVLGFDLLAVMDDRSFPCVLVADAPWDMRSYEDIFGQCKRLELLGGVWQQGGYDARWRPARLEDTNEDAETDVYMSGPDTRVDHAWALTDRVLPAFFAFCGVILLLSHYVYAVLEKCEADIFGPRIKEKPPLKGKGQVGAKKVDASANAVGAFEKLEGGQSSAAPVMAIAGPVYHPVKGEELKFDTPEFAEGFDEIELTGCKSRVGYSAAATPAHVQLADGFAAAFSQVPPAGKAKK
ncbi:hypothetical protein Ctob_000449 [Chrysochromulina tobinii]|jgi:hypothetical protein|uniref:Uncharacterized protein n=1 Tax=Chrysochromulina tobinii TaxID=1460289 RepID=A0A0M0J6Z7_9EUKA|nr:hypothetical protein Ctob_000449 [Chrysochromulina tobinii]|eukprot:KOO21983.1 hypothetical protein Ctob_000449 [Chrysochromulina sp. CCMP291]